MTEETSEAEGPVYCIDSSSLIALWKERYPKDVFPSLWEEKLLWLVEECRLWVCEQVLLEVKQTDLKKLLFPKGSEKNYLLTESPEVKERVIELTNKYPAWAKRKEKRASADPYVIAHAKVQGMVVVADETPFDGARKGEKRKIRKSGPKIPDVCKDVMDVECISSLGLLRKEKWKFW